jgi:hypothetical protein
MSNPDQDGQLGSFIPAVGGYDRCGMSGVKFARYAGIKYSTLAYWLQSRRRKREREKLLMKAGADTESGKSNGAWIEAVVENGSQSRGADRSLTDLLCRRRLLSDQQRN